MFPVMSGIFFLFDRKTGRKVCCSESAIQKIAIDAVVKKVSFSLSFSHSRSFFLFLLLFLSLCDCLSLSLSPSIS